jgi:transcriptional regulator with XRE-family HTH domain
MEKQLNKSSLRSFINKHKSSFPKVLSRLNISKNNDNITLSFISHGVDVTANFMLKNEIWKLFHEEIKKLNINDGDYFFVPKYSNVNKTFVDCEIFFRLRTKQNISFSDLESYCNVNRGTIQQIERNEPYDPSLSTILKYSIFFKKPFYELLYKQYKNQMLNIVLNSFIAKGYIDEKKAEEIYKKETEMSY